MKKPGAALRRPGPRVIEGATPLPRVLAGQAEHSWIHVRGGRQVAGRRGTVGLVERQRDVAVGDVVDIQADHHPLGAKAEVLLDGEVPLADAIAIELPW